MAYFFVTILSFYTNTLLARFHMLNGRRNIRFRDLARSGFGAPCSIAPAHLQLEALRRASNIQFRVLGCSS